VAFRQAGKIPYRKNLDFGTGAGAIPVVWFPPGAGRVQTSSAATLLTNAGIYNSGNAGTGDFSFEAWIYTNGSEVNGEVPVFQWGQRGTTGNGGYVSVGSQAGEWRQQSAVVAIVSCGGRLRCRIASALHPSNTLSRNSLVAPRHPCPYNNTLPITGVWKRDDTTKTKTTDDGSVAPPCHDGDGGHGLPPAGDGHYAGTDAIEAWAHREGVTLQDDGHHDRYVGAVKLLDSKGNEGPPATPPPRGDSGRKAPNHRLEPAGRYSIVKVDAYPRWFWTGWDRLRWVAIPKGAAGRKRGAAAKPAAVAIDGAGHEPAPPAPTHKTADDAVDGKATQEGDAIITRKRGTRTQADGDEQIPVPAGAALPPGAPEGCRTEGKITHICW
jgi:hypothetical protein